MNLWCEGESYIVYQYMNKNGVIARNILTKPDAQDHVHNPLAAIPSSRSDNKLKLIGFNCYMFTMI